MKEKIELLFKKTVDVTMTTVETVKKASINTVNAACGLGKSVKETAKNHFVHAKEKVFGFVSEKTNQISNAVKNFLESSKYVGLVIALIIAFVMILMLVFSVTPSAFVYVYVLNHFGLKDNLWIGAFVVVVVEGLMFLSLFWSMKKVKRFEIKINHIKDSIEEITHLYAISVFKIMTAIYAVAKIPLVYLIKSDPFFIPGIKFVVETVKNSYENDIEEDVVKKIEKRPFKTFFKTESQIKNMV